MLFAQSTSDGVEYFCTEILVRATFFCYRLFDQPVHVHFSCIVCFLFQKMAKKS